MPFDLSTAQPVGNSAPAFDLKTAQPVAQPVTDSQGRVIDPKYLNDPAYKELIDAEQARKTSPSVHQSVLGNMAHAVKELAVGIPETLLSGATGLAASASNLTNATLGTTRFFKQPGESDADYYARTRQDLTYEPRSDLGKGVGLVTGLLLERPVNAAASGVEKLTGDKGAGELTKDALAVLPALVGAPDLSPEGLAIRAEAKLPPLVSGVGPQKINSTTPVSQMRALGLKLRPHDANIAEPGAGYPGNVAEIVGGSNDLRRSLIRHNQLITTGAAAQDIGLPHDTVLIPESAIEQQKAPHIQTYQDVGQAVGKFTPTNQLAADVSDISAQRGISDEARNNIAAEIRGLNLSEMNGPDTVRTISTLRQQGSRYMASEDPASQDFGKGQVQLANALEDELGRQATAIGRPELVPQLQNARMNLAKINNVNATLRGGQVDPQAMFRLKQKGAPLSGRLAAIADAAEYAKNVMQHVSTLQNAGESTGHVPWIGPALDAVTIGMRPWLRHYLGSEGFQNKLGPQATSIGPNGPLGDYFTSPPAPEPPISETPSPIAPSPASAMLRAHQLAGDLQLAPEPAVGQQELPPVPSRLTAEIPAPTPANGVPFRAGLPSAAESLAGDLQLAEDHFHNGGIPFNPPNGPEPGLGARQLLATQEPSRPMNAAPTVPPQDMRLADALGLSTLKGVQHQPIPDEFVMPGSNVIRAGGEKNPAGFLAYGPDQNGGLTISRSTLKPEAQGKGIGKKMLMEAAKQAAEVGKPLHSDTSVTVAQLRVYEALKKDGKLTFEYSNPAAVKAALKQGDPRATVKGNGSPVITNIRPTEQ